MAHGGGGSTMGGKIGTILLLVVIAGVALYFWNSGLIGKSASGIGSFFPPLTSTSSAFTSTPPGFTEPVGAGGTGGVSTVPPPTAIEPPPSTVPPANPTGNPSGTSPFYHEIQFGSVYAGFGGSPGSISIYAYSNQSIDVTGWQIKGNDGSEFIPQAVELYQPSGLAPGGDIYLSNGQTLNMYSSPGTINLRLNECIGYLQNDLRTNPSLPLSCPYVTQSQISNLSGSCQNYILSIPTCTVPGTYSPQISPNDYACQQYLSTINYSGCFSAHERDANFLSNQWWVWTGNNNILDHYHDNVELLDRNGLIVDEYSY